MVVRHDMNLKTMGKVAELLDDMSPFQVGTMGTYKGKAFTLVGRVKVVYPSGTWSEWYALFDDGKEGWLAEAQGNYMMTFLQPDQEIQLSKNAEPMQEIDIAGEAFFVEDVKDVRYASSEGELPFPFTPNQAATSIDLRSRNGKFASVTLKGSHRDLYLGEYVAFETFQFQNLRTIDGW
jgi:hypothetical protein